jgi:predicted RNase H-like nuclease (RuvC/YqgF family)
MKSNMMLFWALGKKEEDDKTFLRSQTLTLVDHKSFSKESKKKKEEREREREKKNSLQVICALFSCQVIFNT